jgi:hypothetical protein
MRGHKALIDMRSKGWKPSLVWLDADSPKLPMTDDWDMVSPMHAHLQLQATDRLATLDLRCLVGLTVFVDGNNTQRVIEARDACIKAGAERVIAYTADHISDTEGHFNG